MTAVYAQHEGWLSPFVDRWRIRVVHKELALAKRVLDIGCGSGLFLENFPSALSYVGVDIDPVVVQENQKRFPGRQFVCLDVLKEPLIFPEGTFDAVVMAAFAEHISSFEFLLENLSRVLAPNGRVLMTTPSAMGMMTHEVLSHLGLLSRHAAEEHKGSFSPRKWRGPFERAGFFLERHTHFEFWMNQFLIYRRRPYAE